MRLVVFGFLIFLFIFFFEIEASNKFRLECDVFQFCGFYGMEEEEEEEKNVFQRMTNKNFSIFFPF